MMQPPHVRRQQRERSSLHHRGPVITEPCQITRQASTPAITEPCQITRQADCAICRDHETKKPRTGLQEAARPAQPQIPSPLCLASFPNLFVCAPSPAALGTSSSCSTDLAVIKQRYDCSAFKLVTCREHALAMQICKLTRAQRKRSSSASSSQCAARDT